MGKEMKALLWGQWKCSECGVWLVSEKLGVLLHPNRPLIEPKCKWEGAEFEQPWEELTPKLELGK